MHQRDRPRTNRPRYKEMCRNKWNRFREQFRLKLGQKTQETITTVALAVYRSFKSRQSDNAHRYAAIQVAVRDKCAKQ